MAAVLPMAIVGREYRFLSRKLGIAYVALGHLRTFDRDARSRSDWIDGYRDDPRHHHLRRRSAANAKGANIAICSFLAFWPFLRPLPRDLLLRLGMFFSPFSHRDAWAGTVSRTFSIWAWERFRIRWGFPTPTTSQRELPSRSIRRSSIAPGSTSRSCGDSTSTRSRANLPRSCASTLKRPGVLLPTGSWTSAPPLAVVLLLALALFSAATAFGLWSRIGYSQGLLLGGAALVIICLFVAQAILATPDRLYSMPNGTRPVDAGWCVGGVPWSIGIAPPSGRSSAIESP